MTGSSGGGRLSIRLEMCSLSAAFERHVTARCPPRLPPTRTRSLNKRKLVDADADVDAGDD